MSRFEELHLLDDGDYYEPDPYEEEMEAEIAAIGRQIIMEELTSYGLVPCDLPHEQKISTFAFPPHSVYMGCCVRNGVTC